MLTQLSVRNFTLVKTLDIEFNRGMTAITGETGAGKSILLNALGLTLGDRADFGQIRQGEQRAEVHASFDISDNNEVKSFLQEQELDQEHECLLRRVINTGGSSKAWINGQPVTLSTLRQLAQRLISIHSQHEHQRLTNKEQQLCILDDYAEHSELLEKTSVTYHEWSQAKQQLFELEHDQDNIRDRKELLQFQVKELDELSLKEAEYSELESDQHRLANAEDIIRKLNQLSELVSESDDFNLISSSSHAQHIAESVDAEIKPLQEAIELLTSAKIQIEEARESIRQAQDSVQLNPELLAEVEARLSKAFELSRKHRVAPEELPDFHQNLKKELEELELSSSDIGIFREKVAGLEQDYSVAAKRLNESRQEYAIQLSSEVDKYFEQLSMSGAKLSIQLNESSPSMLGGVNIEYLIQTNPGAPSKPIGKIASGGELSRISLAIQVVTAQTNACPTLVFDEVDVGIGGATAAVVGDLLQQLGNNSQVICVTHLAQVASQAHHQMGVEKQSGADHTETTIRSLDQSARIREIARMVGGSEVTAQSLAHADGLLRSG